MLILTKFDLNCHCCRASGQLIKICFISNAHTFSMDYNRNEGGRGDKKPLYDSLQLGFVSLPHSVSLVIIVY